MSPDRRRAAPESAETGQAFPAPSSSGRHGGVRIGALVAWHVVSAVMVYVLPSVARTGSPPWALSPNEELQAWTWVVAFLLAASGVTLARLSGSRPSVLALSVLTAWPWPAGFFLLLLRQDVAHSRVIALMSAILGSGLVLVPAIWPIRTLRMAALGPVPVLAIAAWMAVARTKVPRDPEPAATTRVVNSALVPMEVTYQSGLVPEQRIRGGAITRLGARFLLVTATGDWFLLDRDSVTHLLTSRHLAIPAPMSREGVRVPEGYRVPLIRVTGLAIDTSQGRLTAIAAHEVWRTEGGCVSLRVSAIDLNQSMEPQSTWRSIYTTQPCVRPTPEFDQFESGGRVSLRPDGSMFLTVGDYGINRDTALALSQQVDGDYGKVLLISADGQRSLYSRGHRNPGGLTEDRNGRLWVAEHGPRGGDEINLLVQGGNYGWPFATYGTEYGRYEWRFSPPTGTHGSFREPALVLVPSVGISSLIAVGGRLFTSWRGDLLAGSLVGEQLIHVRLVGERAAYAEPITIGRRIRDLVEGEDGRIVLWTDVGTLVSLAPAADMIEGSVVYGVCADCHGLEREGSSRGPHLNNLFDRPVASIGSFEYSAALRSVGGRWTAARLDTFLKNPLAFAPGTTMPFAGIADSMQRRRLLEYLRR